jgi:hypothetical protein
MAKSLRDVSPEGEALKRARGNKKAILSSQKEGDNVVYPYLWRIRIYLKGDLKVDEK